MKKQFYRDFSDTRFGLQGFPRPPRFAIFVCGTYIFAEKGFASALFSLFAATAPQHPEEGKIGLKYSVTLRAGVKLHAAAPCVSKAPVKHSAS